MAPLLDDYDPNWRWKYAWHKNTLSLLPRKCRKSGKSIWFKKAWRIRYEHWSGEDDEWYCEQEYLWMKLKET